MKFRSLLLVFVTAAAVWYVSRSEQRDDNSLVIYCAHDSTFAQPVLDEFTRQTGIVVQVRFDEEANKSLGLTSLLETEKQNPRCDVFWNNQTLGTIRLQERGVLQPYFSPSAERIPESFRDADGHWTGFGARLRVFIVNTRLMPATEEAVEGVLTSNDLSEVAIAQPIFGTTLSHYSVIAAELGMEGVKQWHDDLRRRGIREVRGNSMSKDLVVSGACRIGLTDTDDTFAAIDRGEEVDMIPIRTPSGATICLPNSVAMIRNCPHPKAAASFIDFLLSEQTELSLATGGARQIPLGPVDEQQLPAEVRRLLPWAAEGTSLRAAAEKNEEVLTWLRSEMTEQ